MKEDCGRAIFECFDEKRVKTLFDGENFKKTARV
jgi:hypothetical protein